jgi:predicted DNA-binding transcriptional regulator YafY
VPRPPGALPSPSFQPGPDDVTVELGVRPDGHWVLDLLDGAEVVHADDGTTRVTVATDAPRWIVSLVLAARGEVVVHEPAAVRDAVVRAARAGLGAHAAQPPLERR